jgi:hypothetical protein
VQRTSQVGYATGSDTPDLARIELGAWLHRKSTSAVEPATHAALAWPL